MEIYLCNKNELVGGSAYIGIILIKVRQRYFVYEARRSEAVPITEGDFNSLWRDDCTRIY
jgi:hypothetical protein